MLFRSATPRPLQNRTTLKYTKEWQVSESYQSEYDLEREFIQDLQNQGYEYAQGLNSPEKLLAPDIAPASSVLGELHSVSHAASPVSRK